MALRAAVAVTSVASRHDNKCFTLLHRPHCASVVKSHKSDFDLEWFYMLMNHYHIRLAPAS